MICPQPPADDHEHCPLHGCVEYVCCEPTPGPLPTTWTLSAVSPIGEHWRNVRYASAAERSRVATSLRIAGWTRITLH